MGGENARRRGRGGPISKAAEELITPLKRWESQADAVLAACAHLDKIEGECKLARKALSNIIGSRPPEPDKKTIPVGTEPRLLQYVPSPYPSRLKPGSVFPDIVPWKGFRADKGRKRKESSITSVIFHCSDSGDASAFRINYWHTQGRRKQGLAPWECIGYHFVIRRGGDIEKGRPLGRVGAHCRGHNLRSVGICLTGTLDPKRAWKGPTGFSPEQFGAAVDLARYLDLHLPSFDASDPNRVRGHRDFSKSKTCPDFDVQEKIFPYLQAA